MKISIIVVCLNAGKGLKDTISSVLAQTYLDYEIVVKDGGSTDGSLDDLPLDERIHLIKQKDNSIYDAMNQAVSCAKGDYFLFLNCGDLLAGEKVLAKVAKAIRTQKADIVYGDLIRKGQEEVIVSPDHISDFVCYRNIPCHQVCFYARRLFESRAYDVNYPVRADYEHFLWCKYEGKARFYHLEAPVAIYEGDGFSETKENLKKARREHKEITGRYLGKKCFLYKLIMILTLQPLRKAMADSKWFSGIYQKLKGMLYHMGK